MSESPTDVSKRKKELHNFPEEGPSDRIDESLEINQLRGSLDRRNQLLDVIRKAYHRDVLCVKECLLEHERRVNPFQGFPSLDSVPSIDLRETFRLFAPEGCELRLRPCWTCGGQVEVIHRESARIVDFKRSIQILEERDAKLRMELVDTKVEAQGDRVRLVAEVEKSTDEQAVLTEQILSLKRQVADRNELDAEVRQLGTDKKKLEIAMETKEPILLEHGRLVVEVKAVRDDSKQWEAKFHEQVEWNGKLQNVNDSLTQQLSLLGHQNEQLRQDLMEAHDRCQKADDQCSAFAQNFANSKAATVDVESCLHKAEHAIDELETEFQRRKQQLDFQIRNLESKCSEFGATIRDLDDKSKKNAEEAAYYSKSIQATLEGARSRGLIASIPQRSDEALAKTDELVRGTEHLRQRISVLFNLLLSCIRSTYDNCLVQENLLAANGSELHTNDRKLKTSSEPFNDTVRAMLEHLKNEDKSDVIDWSSILVDETDQRHIIGNLQNRLQLGYFSLDKAFQKIHKAHSTEMQKCQHAHQSSLEDRRLRIWDLEKMLHASNSICRHYEDKMLKMHEKYGTVEQNVDSVRRVLHKLQRECQNNNDIMSMLKDDQGKMNTYVNRLVAELKASKEVILAQQGNLADEQNDVSNRDAAIAQLEAILEQITHKYAENEHRRIKDTCETATQAAPMVADAASHADFLPSLTGDINSDDALIPGRIINLDLENWSRINLNLSRGAVKPGLQYRRALDKL